MPATANSRPRCPSVEPLESALPASPDVETTNRRKKKKWKALHLKPVIKYRKHLYADNAAGEHLADGTGKTLKHFAHDPSRGRRVCIPP